VHFENRAAVPTSPEVLWDFLMDIKSVGECVPGIENVQEIDPDNYQATLKLRVGPIGLRFEGRMSVVERNRDEWRAVMKAEGKDKGAGGAVSANIVMTLAETSPGQTELHVNTDANVLGKLGEFGQPVMRKKADSIMQEFSRNISQRVTARAK
jgi:carbon monoxide dehydrogenase subunit G